MKNTSHRAPQQQYSSTHIYMYKETVQWHTAVNVYSYCCTTTVILNCTWYLVPVLIIQYVWSQGGRSSRLKQKNTWTLYTAVYENWVRASVGTTNGHQVPVLLIYILCRQLYDRGHVQVFHTAVALPLAFMSSDRLIDWLMARLTHCRLPHTNDIISYHIVSYLPIYPPRPWDHAVSIAD